MITVKFMFFFLRKNVFSGKMFSIIIVVIAKKKKIY